MDSTPTIGDNARDWAAQSPWVVLYAMTLTGQFFAAIARALLTTIVLEIIGLLTGWTIPISALAWIVGLAPLLVSVICPPLIAPIDGRWWEISMGGRPPESDEQEAFEEVFAELQEADPSLHPPRHWFVAEDPTLNAGAYSSSLCVNRGLLESPYAAATIAHEMGHLRSSDARITSALNLLVIRQMPTPEARPFWSYFFRAWVWLASGQAVMVAMDNAWEMYWRSREFAADQYATRLGQGPTLAEMLTHSSLPYERPVPHMRFSRNSHPYTQATHRTPTSTRHPTISTQRPETPHPPGTRTRPA
jgi:Zn-dependent protease with chaperone function